MGKSRRDFSRSRLSSLPFKAKKPGSLSSHHQLFFLGPRYHPLWPIRTLDGDTLHNVAPGPQARRVPQFPHLENSDTRSHFCCLCSSQDWGFFNKCKKGKEGNKKGEGGKERKEEKGRGRKEKRRKGKRRKKEGEGFVSRLQTHTKG